MIARRSLFKGSAAIAAAGALGTTLDACAKSSPKSSGGTGGTGSAPKTIKLGFSQVGSESGWRTANTQSIKDAAGKAGITLNFSDAQQKQENQIAAIRNFIAQKVDVISFSPVVTSGWDAVLTEAKRAKIPVILTDRQVDSDQSLYVCLVGSDFEAEGERAAHLMEKVLTGLTGPVNMAQLEGTTGSAPATQRAAGFKKVMDASDPSWKIVISQTGDFTRDGGKQVMAAFLQSHPEINALFAHNDDMAIGAIQAIEEAGLAPGKDILIISIDAVKGAFEAMIAGKLNVTVECSPLLGPQLMSAVKDVVAGKPLPKRIVTEEGIFPMATAREVFPTRKY
jgi:simple sugar transport system substrate-binding protein